ncbi:DUF3727 domain-containing protein [Sulfidibacter corallicola]|uniref:DUF1292 domain-containing protein n=1 Tax=Sulfidibacter corallicola TaxID=2818388 RepID=A0A8A4TS06_SULCO|nr:hypothetical protein [Sulfidibacter corallicola]QTD52759.1 hypothetical protein J3U87_09805 [Sulfidibacter corallicola]
MAENLEKKNPETGDEDDEQEFEVVEMEDQGGETEEFVIISRFPAEGHTYAVMTLLEDFDNLNNMTEEEFDQYYGEESIFFVMRQDEESAFSELDEDEFTKIESILNEHLATLGED